MLRSICACRMKVWAVFAMLALATGIVGCPFAGAPTTGTGGTTPSTPGSGQPLPTPATNEAPSISIASPLLGAVFSIGESVLISFNANDPENDFSYELFWDNDGLLNGDEVTITTGSQTSSSLVQTFWATGALAPGQYYVHVFVVDDGGNTDTAVAGPFTLSNARIQVTAPTSSGTYGPGDVVTIRFTTAGGTGGDAQPIDVFYDTDGDFGNGVTYIVQGLPSSSTQALWTIPADLPEGTYFVGAASGGVAAYATGLVQVVAGASNASLAGLTLEVTEPANNAVLEQGSVLTIEFRGRDTQGTATIDLFYVPDDGTGLPPFTGAEAKIATGLALSADSFDWTINIEPGLYRIGASIGRSATTRLPAYAPGKLLVVGGAGGGGGDGGDGGDGEPTITLTVSTPPANNAIVAPGTPYTVRWVLTGSNSGTIEISVEKPGSGEVVVGSGIAPTLSAYAIDTSDLLGTYTVKARHTSGDGTETTAEAPGKLIVRPPVVWVGELGDTIDGAVFQGVQFRDNAGVAFEKVGDIDGDTVDDMVIVAEFAKPNNYLDPLTGKGPGEAYLIYGAAAGRLDGTYSLNSIGTPLLPGLLITGPYPDDPAETDGIVAVTPIPDQDGDGKPDLAFGIPYCNEARSGGLALRGQMQRGAVIFVSSRDPVVSTRTALNRWDERLLALHEVGEITLTDGMVTNNAQNARWGSMVPPGDDRGVPYLVTWPCEGFGLRMEPAFDVDSGSWSWQHDGPRLANPFLGPQYDGYLPMPLGSGEPPPSPEEGPCNTECDNRDADQLIENQEDRLCMVPNCGVQIWADQVDPVAVPPGNTYVYGWFETMFGGTTYKYGYTNPTGYSYDTKFLPPSGGCGAGYDVDVECSDRKLADIYEYFGARVLGQTVGDRFGVSLSISPGTEIFGGVQDYILIGAIDRAASARDVALPETDDDSPTRHWDPTALGGIGEWRDGYDDREGSGVAYQMRLRQLWDANRGMPDEDGMTAPQDGTLPIPTNVIIRDLGYNRCEPGVPFNSAIFSLYEPNYIVGSAVDEHIGYTVGLGDFNNDGVLDMGYGSPTLTHEGKVYILYRRDPGVEADYLLEDIERSPGDPGRLRGMTIVGDADDRLGTALAAGGDFNGDGYADVLIGNALADENSLTDCGQVLVLFGGTEINSPGAGFNIDDTGPGGLIKLNHALLLVGQRADDEAGATVASAGDFNGDGYDDILIGAPGAEPRFDADGDGVPDEEGLDLDGDGVRDDLDGNGFDDPWESLQDAGKAYLVFGGPHLRGETDGQVIDLAKTGTGELPGVIFVGRRGADITTGEPGDKLGGGRGVNTPADVRPRGVNAAGDNDADGNADIFLGSIEADPAGKINAGEVYLIYGFEPQ
jgi:hypothetical protein